MKYFIDPIPDQNGKNPTELLCKEQNAISIDQFRPESSGHHPRTSCVLAYDRTGLYGRFFVQDRYVRSVATEFQDMVCKDSCVECFIAPDGGEGYLNIEINAGGTLLAGHVIDPSREAHGPLKKVERLTPEQGARIRRYPTLPPVVDPEIQEPISWEMGFYLPFDLMAELFGSKIPTSGTCWKGNFYKCAEKISHPHWASWSPTRAFNFHDPEIFGSLIFR